MEEFPSFLLDFIIFPYWHHCIDNRKQFEFGPFVIFFLLHTCSNLHCFVFSTERIENNVVFSYHPVTDIFDSVIFGFRNFILINSIALAEVSNSLMKQHQEIFANLWNSVFFWIDFFLMWFFVINFFLCVKIMTDELLEAAFNQVWFYLQFVIILMHVNENVSFGLV